MLRYVFEYINVLKNINMLKISSFGSTFMEIKSLVTEYVVLVIIKKTSWNNKEEKFAQNVRIAV